MMYRAVEGSTSFNNITSVRLPSTGEGCAVGSGITAGRGDAVGKGDEGCAVDSVVAVGRGDAIDGGGVFTGMVIVTAAVTVAATSRVGATVDWIIEEGAAVTLGVAGLASPPHAPIIATRNMKAASFMRR
tara:strand:- start:782 stop:1171 length:390 start_codon:yes stop_codon:yes gene_type:complete